MARPKHPVRRRIWRVTPEAPMGEFVELDPAAPPKPDALPAELEGRPEVGDSNWVQSSFDLAIGLDVRDFDDTVPGDLFDELFNPDPRTRK
jgi:hypothetical protein